jgi:hypothetical protein
VPQDEEGGEEQEQPKRRRLDDVPLGIRKPKAPQFDASEFVDDQKTTDAEREADQDQVAKDGDLEPPELHQDYEIRDDDELDRHLEGITTINALKELIQNARDEVEDELETKLKTFSQDRMDELMVYTKGVVEGHGEEKGYAMLKRHILELTEEDLRFAQQEMDRKKDAYLRSSGR